MTEADSYRAEAARLFEVWETRRGSIGVSEARTVTIDHSAGSFIRDGVVCPDEWFLRGASLVSAEGSLLRRRLGSRRGSSSHRRNDQKKPHVAACVRMDIRNYTYDRGGLSGVQLPARIRPLRKRISAQNRRGEYKKESRRSRLGYAGDTCLCGI